jgi:hypothetical protein
MNTTTEALILDHPMTSSYPYYCKNNHKSMEKESIPLENQTKIDKTNISNSKTPITYELAKPEGKPYLIYTDSFYEISKEVRNLKPLHKDQLKYIQSLPK